MDTSSFPGCGFNTFWGWDPPPHVYMTRLHGKEVIIINVPELCSCNYYSRVAKQKPNEPSTAHNILPAQPPVLHATAPLCYSPPCAATASSIRAASPPSSHMCTITPPPSAAGACCISTSG